MTVGNMTLGNVEIGNLKIEKIFGNQKNRRFEIGKLEIGGLMIWWFDGLLVCESGGLVVWKMGNGNLEN